MTRVFTPKAGTIFWNGSDRKTTHSFYRNDGWNDGQKSNPTH
jgi:hypothetical protein